MEPAEYDNIARLEQKHWWYLGMRAVAEAFVQSIARHSRQAPLDILDAGCGTGGSLRWLAAYGNVAGLDLYPQATLHAARASSRLARATVQALPFGRASFDLVTSFDVLYHQRVTDDEQALREVARVLRGGGHLLLRLPAYDWLRGAHDRQVHTRHRYSAPEVRLKLARAGLEVVRLTYLGLCLVPPALLRRALHQSSATGSDMALPPAPLNRLLIAPLRLEGLWLRFADLPAGLSLLALARKSHTRPPEPKPVQVSKSASA